MTKLDETKRRQWLGMLARLTAPGDSIEAAKGLASMVPLLGDLGDGVFCTASLDLIARASLKRPPTYGELRAHLDSYAEAIRPKKIHAPILDRDAEQAIKRADERAEAERAWSDPHAVLRAVASLDGHPMRITLGSALAGLVLRHAPQNGQYLPPEFVRPAAPKVDRFARPVAVAATANLTAEQLHAAYGGLPSPRPAVDSNRGRSLPRIREPEEFYG